MAETYYFSHDYNARNHVKLKCLMRDWKAAGYGLFWILAERMHEDENSLFIIDELSMMDVASDAGITTDELLRFITDCVDKYKLFTLEEETKLSSDRVTRNKDQRSILRSKRAAAGRKGAESRWQKDGKTSDTIADDMATMATASSNMANDGKGKEKREKEKKEIVKEGGETSSPATAALSLEDRELDFYTSLVPHIDGYGQNLLRNFYNYWREPNKANTKMRWECEATWHLELRLERWAKNERNYDKNRQEIKTTRLPTAQELLAQRGDA